MENNDKGIIWEFTKRGYFNENEDIGAQTTTEEFGYLGGKLYFIRFRVWEKTTSNTYMDYKITQQTIFPL